MLTTKQIQIDIGHSVDAKTFNDIIARTNQRKFYDKIEIDLTKQIVSYYYRDVAGNGYDVSKRLKLTNDDADLLHIILFFIEKESNKIEKIEQIEKLEEEIKKIKEDLKNNYDLENKAKLADYIVNEKQKFLKDILEKGLE